MGRGILWRNKCVGGPNAWCNSHTLSWYDVIGCNTATAVTHEYCWLQKTHREHLFYFISCLFCFSRSKLLHTFNGPFLGFQGLPTWAVTRKVKPIWILMKQETVSGSGISWDICKSAPRSRQITMPAPHHSVFYRPDALPVAQPTVSKHWRHGREKEKPSLFWPWYLWLVQFRENH